MTGLALALLLAVLPAAASELDHSVNQARHFLKKGWIEDARAELERAAATPEGSQSFTVRWMLSQVAWDMDDPEAALQYARLALEVAATVEEAEPARAFVAWCASSFGALEVAGPHAGLRSRLAIEPSSTIIDPNLKKYVNRVGLRLKDGVMLPTSVWLPAGTWLVNGREVLLEPGKTATLDLPLTALGSRGLAALQVLRLEVSSGFGVWFGDRVSNLHPGIETQLALTQPVGRALVGVTADHTFRTWDMEGWGSDDSPEAWTFGARVGMEWFGGGALALRPSLGYRFGWLPGIAFDCVEDDAGLSCAPPEDEPSDASVHAVATVHVPMLELSVDWREGGRITALGIGVRVAVDQAFGRVPDEIEGTWGTGTESTVPVRVSDGTFTATGVRVLANLSFAL